MYENFFKEHVTQARVSGEQIYGLCPFHNDTNASFSANIHSGLWKCHGCEEKGNAPQFADRLGIDLPRQVYVYDDEQGKPLFRVIRSHPKKFSQERFDGGEWISGVGGVRRVLYRLPAILSKKWVCIVEGEKDADRLWSIGIPATCNPGGAGKWRDEFSECLRNKKVVIIPDNDAQGSRHAGLVAKSLTPVTNNIKIVNLPELPDKGDVSDWLNAGHSKDALLDLFKSTDLVTPESLPLAEESSEAKPVPAEFQDRRIHPALHIESGFAAVGVVQLIGGQLAYSIISSRGEIYDVQTIKERLTTSHVIHPDLAGRWTRSSELLPFSESAALLIDKMKGLISFEDERWYYAAALWCAGTYLFPAFPAFPYFQLTGEKGSGKTKVQDIFTAVCFNAIKLVDPTPAVLFRIVEATRPTLLIDEAERMSSDEARAVNCILNAGYKAGSSVSRVEGDQHQLRFYNVYCPKSFSSIRSLGSVTEDRCITAVMSRPPRGDCRQNKSVNPGDPDWLRIRNGFYRLPFTHSDKVFQTLDSLPLPDWLTARDRELWLPVLWLASQIDNESGLGVFEDVINLAQEIVKSKGMNFETEALLSLLEEKLGGESTLQVRPGELVHDLEERLNRKIRPEWVGHRLKSLGMGQKHRDNRGQIYEIDAERLVEFRARYTT